MKNWSILFMLLLLFSCKQDANNKKQQTTPTEPFSFALPDWAKDAVIYEVNTRQFSPEGNFKGIQDQLDRLQDMGIDILWLMPINPISELKRKATGDVLVKDIEDVNERAQYYGSPYAVADYTAVNPDYGNMADFKNLLKACHARGMKLIIDWVPNHTGWDNAWITDHPEWYTKNVSGEITDPINPDTGESWGWTDVADLDYSNTDMRAEMQKSMLFWIENIGIDGFRVDVAHGIAQDFWDDTAPKLTAANNDIFLLAESEVPSHRNEKTFHADYGWGFHHLMNHIAKGENNAADIDKWHAENKTKYSRGFHMHFTSNHDENTWAGTVFDRMGEGHRALAVLAATFDGMPLLYSGMEEPMRKRLPFFTKEFIGFKDYAYADFYKALFTLKKDNQAIWNGAHGGELVKLVDHENVYAFKREKNGDEVIGIINLSNAQQSITLPEAVKGRDIFTGQQVDWKGETALGMEPWQYYILSNK